jgi:hypothetical protein
MKYSFRLMKVSLFAALTLAVGFAPQAHAELQLAQKSLLTGMAFEDLPFQLPVERNFQMALLSVSGGIGRSCGKMEAYGWRMDQSEQDRVNAIFKTTLGKLREAGFTVAPATVNNQSKDITLFTADKPSQHFMFLWSAGERGLVLNLCETNAPLASPTSRLGAASPSVEVFPLSNEPQVRTMTLMKSKGKGTSDGFSPAGRWIGGYTCTQGYTGSTLTINHLRGDDFKGTFEFYPTEKNRNVPAGSYEVYGQYDKASKRILINPGKWIKHPKGYFNTVVVGSFSPAQNSFSGFFQGIAGCTSFEARRNGIGGNYAKKVSVGKEQAKKKPAKKAKPKASAAPVSSVPAQDPLSAEAQKDLGIVLTPTGSEAPPSAAPAAAVEPAATGPASPTPALQPTPASPASKLAVPPAGAPAPAAEQRPFIPSEAMKK